jgi:hypothetical protein
MVGGVVVAKVDYIIRVGRTFMSLLGPYRVKPIFQLRKAPSAYRTLNDTAFL